MVEVCRMSFRSANSEKSEKSVKSMKVCEVASEYPIGIRSDPSLFSPVFPRISSIFSVNDFQVATHIRLSNVSQKRLNGS